MTRLFVSPRIRIVRVCVCACMYAHMIRGFLKKYCIFHSVTHQEFHSAVNQYNDLNTTTRHVQYSDRKITDIILHLANGRDNVVIAIVVRSWNTERDMAQLVTNSRYHCKESNRSWEVFMKVTGTYFQRTYCQIRSLRKLKELSMFHWQDGSWPSQPELYESYGSAARDGWIMGSLTARFQKDFARGRTRARRGRTKISEGNTTT